VSFGVNGSTITASASNVQSNQQMTMFATGNTSGSSSGTTNASSMIFRGSGALTVAITNGSIVFDAPSAAAGNVTFSAGANSAGLNSIVFSNSNNVSFGLNGSTITASASGVGGGGATLSEFVPVPLLNNLTAFSSNQQNSVYFDPIDLACAISFTRVANLWSMSNFGLSSSTTVTGQHGLTVRFGMYSRSVTDSAATNFSNSSNWVTMWTNSCWTTNFWSATSSSVSQSIAWMTDSTGGSSSASFSTNGVSLTNRSVLSQKRIILPMATSVGPGNYIFAQAWSSSTAGNANASSLIRASNLWISQMSNVSWGTNYGGDTQSLSGVAIAQLGYYSSTSAALPTSLNTNQISALYARRLMTFQA
jgi:hypothetical protein